MFDWFWWLLYALSKLIMKLCDAVMDCARVLIGLDPITVKGTEINIVYYMFQDDRVTFGFATVAVLSIIALTIFTIIQILKNVAKMGEGQKPSQIVLKAFKAFVTFLFVPTCMFAMVDISTVFMQALYEATTMGQTSIGQFMFVSFAESGDAWANGMNGAKWMMGGYSYSSKSDVDSCIDISEFDNFFCWLAGFQILESLTAAMLMFVDRLIALVILFVLAPIPIAASVIDEGQRFKNWREQVLNKFFVGFGVILAMNFYILVVSMVVEEDTKIFSNWFTNLVGRILFILGGGKVMKKSGALIGSLVSASGGNEVNDPAFQGNALKSALKAAVTKPIAAAAATYNFAKDAKEKGFKAAIGKRLGFDVGGGGGGGGGGGSPTGPVPDGDGNKQENDPKYNDPNGLNGALKGGNEEEGDKKKGEGNENNGENDKNKGKGNELVNNAINNGENNQQQEDNTKK